MIKLMGVNLVFVFLLLSLSIIKAQEYVILGEFEPDTWDEEDDPSVAEKALSALSENYRLNDLLGERYHVLHKREVGDNEGEDGSGVGEPPHPEVSNQNSTTAISAAAPQIVPEIGAPLVNSSDNSQPAEPPLEKVANITHEISSNNNSSKKELSQNKQNSSTIAPSDAPKKHPEAMPAVDHSDSEAKEKDDKPGEDAVQKGEDKISDSVDINEDKQLATSLQNTTLQENNTGVKSSKNEENNKEKDEVQEPQLPLNNQTFVNIELTASSTPIAIASANSTKPPAAVEQKVDEAPLDTNNLTVSLREPQGGNMDFENEAAIADHEHGNKEEQSHLEKEQNGNGEPQHPEVSIQNSTATATSVATPKTVPEVGGGTLGNSTDDGKAVESTLQKVAEVPEISSNNVEVYKEENKETPQDPSKNASAIEKVFEAAANETEKLEDQKVNSEEVRPSSTTHDIPRHQTTIAPPIHISETTAANGTEKLDKDQKAKNDSVPEQLSSVHSIPRHETTVAPPVQSSEALSSTAAIATIKKVLPSDLAEAASTTASKTVELINDQQSGNAVMFKEPTFVAKAPIEASDSERHLASLATNAKVSNASSDSEEPNTGESARAVSKAGKDTTILIVLFVVVIVVGAAAFTHNFIKKRKQNAAQNSDLVNGMRRSLQNLTSEDVEQGTEMKPLIKTNSPIIVKEYSDTKKEAEA